MTLPRWLEVLLLKHRRRALLDDIEHFEGVARLGARRIADIRDDNRRRQEHADAIGRRLIMLERPDVLLRAELEARET